MPSLSLCLRALFCATLVCLATVRPALAQVNNLGFTQASGGHVTVVHGVAYSARHDVYLTVYEGPGGVYGRFVNASGQTVGDVFAVATTPGQAIVYANKPMVAYSHDTAGDVFFVMYASDYNKAPDAAPAAWIQRVSFTGTGGARVGNPIQVGDRGWEIPNDLVYNPVTRQFVAVWERFYSEGPDVMVRFFNEDGSAGSAIINTTTANHGQGAAKAAVDWERNRILIAYQGLHPNSPTNPEVLGLWAKIINGGTGAAETGLLTVQNGFSIEAVPVFLPEADGFAVAWTAFNPGRDVLARYVSSADGAVGAMPLPVYTIAGTGRQEGAAMGMYDAVSRRVLMAIQSSGGCPNDTCPYLDGAVLDAGGGVAAGPFTQLSTAVPSATGGTFYPDVAVGEGGQFGLSYSLNYAAVFVQRLALPAAGTPGPSFGGGSGPPPSTPSVLPSPSSLSFAVTKSGATLGSVAPQTVTVTLAGGASGSWTATTSTPWIQIGSGSGSGNGSFSATIINPSDVIGTQTALSGSITLTAASASNSPVTIPVSLSVSANTGGAITPQGTTQASGSHVTVVHGIAYAARHDVYLTVYEGPGGILGRFVNSAGQAVGSVFAIATTPGQAIVYANKPMVAYSHDTAGDVFFVMYASDYGKTPDAAPSAWIQRVSFTGTGGARVGNPIQVGSLGWEIPNDLVYNPVTRQFVAVWERFYSEGPDVMVRFFNEDGSAGSAIINTTTANHGQGAAKAAVDWERNRILIAYQGLHPNSPSNPEVLGLWAKIINGGTGAAETGLLTVQNGFTIEAVPVFLPEADGFAVAWTGFNPGRDVQARYVSSADGAVGSMPLPIYTIAGSGRQEGAAMGMYDAVSRRVLMAIQSSGGCPNDTCPYLDGAILDAGGGVALGPFTQLSSAVPTSTGGTFYPDVAVGEGGQFGVSYSLNYSAVFVERIALAAAGTPGPSFGGGSTGPATGVAVAPNPLAMAISKRGTAIAGSPLTVLVSFTSGTAGPWTATSSTPWIRIGSGSGTGNGSFTVTIVNPSDTIGSQTSLTGAITVTAASAPNSPLSVPVNLSVTFVTLTAAPPIGQVDTPTHSSTQRGAISVTGWALDDTSVSSVRVYRTCHVGIDPSGVCQIVLGHNVVWVGDAVFLTGARPDVEAALPLYPNAARAGWGLQVLSNMLPHVPNSRTTGGQGAFTFYAVATDSQGNARLLGRSADPASATYATPTQVTLDNDTLARPFGTLDTPAPGATVSGTIPIFGWALTPDSDTVSGNVDRAIPTDGSTVVVLIDGAPVANVTYNQCRGTNLNGGGSSFLAPGAFCNDDIANLFGNSSPAPVFTSRSSNPTRFRNLDAGRGAIGSWNLNTATLSNGVHTIAWRVVDSGLNEEGLGSRTFIVNNAPGDTGASLAGAPALSRGAASSLSSLPVGAEGVWGRTGFDFQAEWLPIAPDAEGLRTVRIPEMGRLELWLGLEDVRGFLVTNGELRDLPIGSTLQGAMFSWGPPVGMLGTYHLAFVRAGERLDVQVTIEPAATALEGAQVRMALDPATVSAGQVTVTGWAFDPKAAIGTGIAAVHVWARRTTPGATDAPVFLGEAALGLDRADALAAGFSLRAPLGAGTWEITAYVWNRRTARWEDARSVTVVRP